MFVCPTDQSVDGLQDTVQIYKAVFTNREALQFETNQYKLMTHFFLYGRFQTGPQSAY